MGLARVSSSSAQMDELSASLSIFRSHFHWSLRSMGRVQPKDALCRAHHHRREGVMRRADARRSRSAASRRIASRRVGRQRNSDALRSAPMDVKGVWGMDADWSASTSTFCSVHQGWLMHMIHGWTTHLPHAQSPHRPLTHPAGAPHSSHPCTRRRIQRLGAHGRRPSQRGRARSTAMARLHPPCLICWWTPTRCRPPRRRSCSAFPRWAMRLPSRSTRCRASVCS